MLSRLAVLSILFYRRHLSPLKGYRCAAARAGASASCSSRGLRIFRRTSFLAGLRLLRRQFDRCALAAGRLQGQRAHEGATEGRYLRLQPQRGLIDCDCGVCDLPDADCGKGRGGGCRLLGHLLDGLGACNCGGGGGKRRSGCGRSSTRSHDRYRERKWQRKKRHDSGDSSGYDNDNDGDGDGGGDGGD